MAEREYWDNSDVIPKTLAQRRAELAIRQAAPPVPTAILAPEPMQPAPPPPPAEEPVPPPAEEPVIFDNPNIRPKTLAERRADLAKREAALQPPPLSEADQLAQSVNQVLIANRNPHAGALLTVSRDRGNMMGANNKLLNDYESMHPIDFRRKYGTELYDEVVAFKLGGQAVHNLENQSSRDLVDHARDLAISVPSGFVQGVGSAGVFGTSLFSDRGAIALSKGLGWLQETTDSYKSPELRRLMYVDALRRTLDNQDSSEEYKISLARSGDPFLAGLESFGRGVLKAGGRALEDPGGAGLNMVEEGLGSLGTGGVVKKGLEKGASKLLTMAGAKAIPAYASTVESAIAKAAFPIGIGAMEGGGAYSQVTQEIMNKSPKEMATEFPTYNDLIKEGWTHEQAQLKIAGGAGRVAEAIAFPIGALTGKLVHGLEAKPLTSILTTPKQALTGALAEPVEEGIQGGAGQVGVNVGKQVAGGSDVPTMEGVGEAAGEGAIVGGGTGAVVAGPAGVSRGVHGAINTAAAALETPLRKLSEIKGKVTDVAGKVSTAAGTVAGKVGDIVGGKRGEQVQAQAEAAATTSPEILAPAVAAAAEQAPVVAEAVRTMATEAGATDEQTNDYIQRVQDASTLRGSDIKGLTRNIRTALQDFQKDNGVPNRFQALDLMAGIAGDETASEEDRIAAGTFILNLVNQNKQLFENDVPDFMNKVSKDRPEYQLFDQYAGILSEIQENKSIQKSLEWAQTKMKMSDVDMSTMDPGSDKAQDIINNAINVATHAPQALNESVANQILMQDANGTIKLTSEGRSALRGAAAMQAEDRTYQEANAGNVASTEETAGAAPQENRLGLVNRQIETQGGPRQHQDPISKHVAEINQAIADKNMTAAKARIERLGKFAESHANKVEAINKTIANQKIDPTNTANEPYKALASSGTFYENKKGAGVTLGNAGTEAFARQVHNEAVGLANQYNHYVEQNPELGLKPRPVPTLDLPGSRVVPGQTRGSSTATQQVTQLPATTSGTAATEQQLELPLTPAPGQKPAATNTTAATDQTRPPSKPETAAEAIAAAIARGEGETGSSVTPTQADELLAKDPVEFERRKKWFEGRRDIGKLTKGGAATLDEMNKALERNKAPKPETKPEVKPAETKGISRIPAEELRSDPEWEDTENLQKEIDRIEAKGNLTPDDHATIEALSAEVNRRNQEVTPEPTHEEIVEEIKNTIWNSGWNHFGDSHAWNEQLDKLTDEELIPFMEELERNKYELSDITGKAKEAVDQLLQEASDILGIDATKLIRFVKAGVFKGDRPQRGGQFSSIGPAIHINKARLDAFNNGEIPIDVLRHILFHELGHAVDFHSMGPTTTATEMGTSAVGDLFSRTGEFWTKFQNLKNATNNPSNEPLWNYLNRSETPGAFANEFFSELHAFALSEQALLQEFYPDLLKAVEEIVQRAADNRGLGTARLGAPVSTDGGVSTSQQGKPKGKDKFKTATKNLADLRAALEARKLEASQDQIPTQEPVSEPEPEPETLPLEEAFKDLVTPSGHNWFFKAFTRAKKIGSRLRGMGNPIVTIYNALQNSNTLSDLVGNADAMPAKKGAFREYLSYTNQILAEMTTRLNETLSATESSPGKAKVPLLDRLEKGVPVNRYMELKALNLLEKVGDTYRYNQELVESAVLAGMDWLLNIQDRIALDDAEKLAGILGIDEDLIDANMLAEWNRGVSTSTAVRSLADHIKRFWDVRDNKAVSETYVQGVAQAMALEVIAGMDKAGLLAQGMFSTPFTGLTYGQLYFDQKARGDDIHVLMQSLKADRNTISDIALVDKLRTGRSVGEKITQVATHQLRNSNIETTPQQKRALINLQKAMHFTNMAMHDFMQALGMENYVKAMGGGELDPAKTNVNDFRSKTGVRLGLTTAFQNMLDHVAEVKAYAEKHDIPVSEVPTFFEYAVTSVGRMQMRGTFNSQANKLARNIVTPVRAVVNLTKPASRQFTDFLQGIGQGLGVKTESLSRRAAVSETYKKLDLYRPIIDGIKAHLQEEKKGPLPQDVIDAILNLAPADKLADHGFQALLDYARYEVSRETGADLSRFESWNFLEADGKSNGPINALMLWAAGQITPRWLELIEKGGMFFGVKDKSLDQHVDKVDLYKMSGNTASTKVGEKHTAIINDNNTKVLNQFNAFRRVMKALDVKVVVNGDSIELTRQYVKNPLTITVYYSGPMGIANKATNEIVSYLYERISESLRTGTNAGALIYADQLEHDFQSDLNMLFDSTPFKHTSETDKEGRKWDKMFGLIKVTHKPTKAQTLQQYTLSETQFDALRDNVKFFLTDPLVEAITEDVMGELKPVLKTIQQATQVQSIVVRSMFHYKVMAKIADKQLNPSKYPDYNPRDFLSQDELNEIYKSLAAFMPVIDTKTQRYQVNSKERADVLHSATLKIDGVEHRIQIPESLAISLVGDMKTPVFMQTPDLAGVKSIPYVNIGSGDGQMMLYGMSIPIERSDISQRSLAVFDGLNMPIDKIQDYSRLINESVFKTWTLNSPMRAIAEGFREFYQQRPIEQMLTNDPLNVMMENSIKEMAKVFYDERNPDGSVNEADMNEMIEGIITRLDSFADDLETRQQVYRETTQSVDQMASGKSPHVHIGSIALAPNASRQDIAMAMEGRRIELNNAKAKIKNQAQAVPLVSASTPVSKLPPSMQRILGLGREDLSGVRVLQGDQLPDMAKNLTNINSDPQFVRQLIKAISKDYRIVFGTPSQLDAWELANNADRFVSGSNDSSHGKIDPVAKIILISNLSGETLVHELIHAATIDKVRGYYSNQRSLLSDADRDAIHRIEGLMNEWRLLDFGNPDEAILNGSQMAQSAVEGWIQKGKKEGDPNKYMAQAVNEFMAWTLTNQNARAKARTIKNSAFRIFGEALELIKKLMGFGKSTKVANNLLAQLQFNTRILISKPTPLELFKTDANSVTMFQSSAFGSNDRLTYLRERINEDIHTYLTEGDPNILEHYHRRLMRDREIQEARQASSDIVVSMVQHFPDLVNMQAWSTYYALQTILHTQMKLNPNSLVRMQELYDHTISKLQVKDFRENTDPNDQADITQAQNKFNAVHGLFVKKIDKQGRSSLMSSFVALAMTSDSFRAVLAKIDKPNAPKSDRGGLDGLVENAGIAGMDWLSLHTSSENASNRNVQEAMDDLTVNLIDNVGDQRSAIEQGGEGFIGGIDRYIYNNMQALGSSAIDQANAILATNPNAAVTAGAKLVRLAGTMINEQKATAAAQGLVNSLAKIGGLHEITAIVNDFVLRTEENAPVYDMLSLSRSTAQQTRQRYRDEVPDELANHFSRPVTKEERTAMFNAMGRTDIATLMATHGATRAIEMITDSRLRNQEIRSLEASIRAADPQRAARILQKAKQLADHMNTGVDGDNLLPNAHAIAHLYGEVGHTIINPVSQQFEDDIDVLTTLYAMNDLTQATRDRMQDLVLEQDGLDFVFHYLVGQRKDELAKAKATSLGRINHYKGNLPSEKTGGDDLRIESNNQHARMQKLGYTRVDDYHGSAADLTLRDKTYYYSPVAGLAPYRQGVMQTVHLTASGVDPQSGYSVGRLIAGRITDGRVINQTLRGIANQGQTNEHLRRVYDDDGHVIALERMADPVRTMSVARNTDLFEMIGAWRGRQVEEIFAQEINTQLVNALWKIWDTARSEGRQNEFVNVLTSTDPVIMNTAKLIPNQSKDHIRQKFGPDTFMVHRSMALNALGDRQASVGDLFTGETRWKPAVQQRFENIALGLFSTPLFEKMFGNNGAYIKLVEGERLVQNVITNVKYNIVVKSVIVPAANIMSNIGQLLNRDVPLRHILEGIPKKVVEINDYIKMRSLEVRLEAELRSAEGKNDLVAIRKLGARLEAMEDAKKRLSIYPLIKAGEFSAISNGEVTAEDLALAEGKWSNFMDKMIAKIPDGPVRTVARYGLVTRDTAMFQALAKSVQYGDFVAKAILYDDLMNRQGSSNKDAIATVNQAFVPYNNLSGRGRHYLESMGMMWFYNYKLRIMKESVHLLRHHPFRALLMNTIPGLDMMDSPLDSNFVTTAVDGKLGYSLTPEMALHSWTLNPWVNAIR